MLVNFGKTNFVNNACSQPNKVEIIIEKVKAYSWPTKLLINSIDKDGPMQEYDLDMATLIKRGINIPVTCLRGFGSLDLVSGLIAN